MLSATTSEARKPQRSNHRWGLIVRAEDGTWSVECKNCGLIERHGYYLGEHGQTLEVLQWLTPRGKLLRIRPIVDIRPTSKGELRIDAAFPGAEVGGIPACPKSPDAWSQQKSQAGGAARR